jgi:hypothetical protein
MCEAYNKFVKVASKMVGMEKREPKSFELRATRSMFKLETGSFEFILSPAAKDFIEQNDLGEFSIRFDDAEDWLMIAAPSDEARVLFRLAFS